MKRISKLVACLTRKTVTTCASSEVERLVDVAGQRLRWQRNYEPKLRALVETRSKQMGFEESERLYALRSIDALMWKQTAAGIHLERLWENRESFDFQRLVASTIGEAPDPRRYTSKETAFLTAELEAYLIQAVAFINVGKVHTLDACRVKFGGMLTNTKYDDIVRRCQSDSTERLVRARDYFSQNVFGPNKWGQLLRDLRDRVVHFDRIRASESVSGEGSEELRVRGLRLEQLAQEFETGTYDILVNVVAPIWERKWQPGPYSSRMWE